MFVGKRLFVGNLPDQTSSADLNQLFSEFGTVQSVEISKASLPSSLWSPSPLAALPNR
jgi:RNA recognition motif-containing protein